MRRKLHARGNEKVSGSYMSSVAQGTRGICGRSIAIAAEWAVGDVEEMCDACRDL